MKFTEHAILRRVAHAAAAYHAATTRDRPPLGAELKRWLTVLEAWDAVHPHAPGPLFEDGEKTDG